MINSAMSHLLVLFTILSGDLISVALGGAPKSHLAFYSPSISLGRFTGAAPNSTTCADCVGAFPHAA
jgi:hypothetical protein